MIIIDKIVDVFLVKTKSEKKHNLRDVFTSIASDVIDSKIMLVEDNENNVIGIWGAKIHKDSFKVIIIRTIKSKLSNVLFKQLIDKLISLSIEKRKAYIFIDEPYLDEEQKQILNSFGFLFKNDNWVKLIDNGVVNSLEYFSSKNITNGY